MAQTAIDLLFEKFDVLNSDLSIPVSVVLTPKDWVKLYIKFKSIEKEQICNAFDKGWKDEMRIGEEYYNETYGL